MKFPDSFPVAIFIAIVAGPAPTLAATEFTSVEKWVLERVKAGEVADLKYKFPEVQERKIGSEFLQQLATGKLADLRLHGRGIMILSAKIAEPLDLRNAKIDSDLILYDCEFQKAIDLANAHVSGALSFDQSTFQGAVELTGVEIDRTLSIKESIFNGSLRLVVADIKDEIHATKSRFNAKKEQVNLNTIKVQGSANFDDCVFEGPVVFYAAHFGSFSADGAEFRSDSPLWLSMHCGETAFFKKTFFGGPVLFTNSSFVDLVISEANHGRAPVPKIDLSFCLVKRRLELKTTTIEKLIAHGLHVEGPASLTRLELPVVADLSYSEFASIDISASTWPSGTDIQGVHYRHIRAAQNPNESNKALIAFVGKCTYAADVYANLEHFFVERGYRTEGDQVFIAGKQRVRNELPHWRPAWLGSLLLDWLVGYGRHPWQAGIPCIFFVALGCLLFSREKMERQEPEEPRGGDDPLRGYSRLWYSLGLFLPFVDLKSDRIWKPQDNRWFLRHYMRVHILLGWILIPVLLAAISGLIK